MCDWKRILMGGFAGAMVLPLLFFFLTLVLNVFFPFNPFLIPGARPIDSPEAWLFLAYPLVLSFAAAFVFDLVHHSFPRKGLWAGLYFAGILILVESLPNFFFVFTTMDYSANFFPHMIARSVLGYVVLGLLFAYIWKK